MRVETFLFRGEGPQHTEKTLELAIEWANKLGNKSILISSTTGESARKALDMIPDDFKLVVVTHHTGFRTKNKNEFSEDIKNELLDKGHYVLTTTHAFSGVERTFRKKFGGLYPLEIMAQTLRMFCEGVKVAVEIAIMAADAGLVDVERWIVSCGGTARGLDTAVFLKPANSNSVFDLEIGGIICKPVEESLQL